MIYLINASVAFCIVMFSLILGYLLIGAPQDMSKLTFALVHTVTFVIYFGGATGILTLGKWAREDYDGRAD